MERRFVMLGGGLAAAALIAGCGAGEHSPGASTTAQATVIAASATATPVSTGTPSPAASPSPPSGTPGAEFALVTAPSGLAAGPPYSLDVTFYRPDGSHGAPIAVRAASAWQVTVAAGSVWFTDPADHLVRVRPDGSTVTAGTLSPSPAGTGLAVSPDGSQWIWPVWTFSGASATAAIWIGGTSTPPHMLVSSTHDGHKPPYYVPRTWAQSGPIVIEQPDGIGGRILYGSAVGQADRLDVSSGRLTKLLDPICEFDDISANGTMSCADYGNRRNFDLVYQDGRVSTVAVPPGPGTYGDSRFDAQGRLLAIGYETGDPASSGAPVVATDIVNLANGRHTRVTHPELTPAAWTPSGRLVAVDRFSSYPATPAFLVDTAGQATPLDSTGQIVAAGPVTGS